MGDSEDLRLRRSLAALLATVSIVSAGNALAQDIAKASTPEPGASSSEEIGKKLERMEQRIRSLEAELKKKNDVAAASSAPGNPATPASAANPPGAKPVRAAAGAPDWVTSSQPATANPPAANGPAANPQATNQPGGKPAKPEPAGAPDWVKSSQPADPGAASTADAKPADAKSPNSPGAGSPNWAAGAAPVPSRPGMGLGRRPRARASWALPHPR